MSDTNGNGRIELLGHKPPRPTKAQIEKQMTDDIAVIARNAVIPVIEHYMTQIPELVARMLAEAFAANGLELKPPPPKDSTKEKPT